MVMLYQSNKACVTIYCTIFVFVTSQCSAFLQQPPGGRHGGMGPPRSSRNDHWGASEDSDFDSFGLFQRNDRNETGLLLSDSGAAERKADSSTAFKSPKRKITERLIRSRMILRGGSTKTKSKSANKSKDRKFPSLFKSKEKQKEEELLEKLQTMPVKSVTIPTSTVLPSEVVQVAAEQAGMIGNPLRTDRVQRFAELLKQWYARRGYVLNSVTGANLQADTATAEIAVEEPMLSTSPVAITICKQKFIDEETGELLTPRQYRAKLEERKKFGRATTINDANITFVETRGKTNPTKVATALGLSSGECFRWDANRWQNVASSGIFSRILRASPQRMEDGTVQLQIIATEKAPRHLEYGVTKSLYTGSWEGEIDFQHGNLLGGGESLGLVVRRGAKDAEPSLRLQYSDSKFGMAGGYDVEAFSDYIGKEDSEAEEINTNNMLGRKGLSVRLVDPFDQKYIQSSTASACLERTTTHSGNHEMIGSTTVGVGPFVKELPYDARSNIDGSITAGARMPEIVSSVEGSSRGSRALPYASTTITTRQKLPLMTASSSSEGRPVVLALRHALTTSSPNLPGHEANALGIAATIRGGSPPGQISSSLVGTTELRVPIQLLPGKAMQDTSAIIFCDWAYAKRRDKSKFFRQSSVGVGLRKSLQGLPLKVDFSYSNEGKIRSMFGLGRDFEV